MQTLQSDYDYQITVQQQEVNRIKQNIKGLLFDLKVAEERLNQLERQKDIFTPKFESYGDL